MPSEPSKAGIVTDDSSGERHIPESLRADGTKRKAIKIRPGYRPPEDVEVYKNRTAESFRTRGKGGIPGAEGLKDDKGDQGSAASNKNAKRREARKKAKEAGEDESATATTAAPAEPPKPEEVDPAAEKEKKARNLRKKLKQATDLKNKKETGEALLPEQIAKVIKINELIRGLKALGFDAAEGEPQEESKEQPKDDPKKEELQHTQ
jgi:partner of Y14 and mago protein